MGTRVRCPGLAWGRSFLGTCAMQTDHPPKRSPGTGFSPPGPTTCPSKASKNRFQPRNGSWAVCRPRAPTRRWRCRMPGAPGQGTRPTALSSPSQPHPEGEPLESCPWPYPTRWNRSFLALGPSWTAVSKFNASRHSGRFVGSSFSLGGQCFSLRGQSLELGGQCLSLRGQCFGVGGQSRSFGGQ